MNVNVSNFCLKIFCQSFVLLLISCCNFTVIDYSETGLNSYDLNFDSDIPIKLQSHLIFSLGVNKNIKEKKSNIIEVSDFVLKTYDVYSGDALRALETEVKSSLILSISKGAKKINKKLMVMKRYNANELNILAEKEMLDFIRDEIYSEFVNQILTEVNLIEV